LLQHHFKGFRDLRVLVVLLEQTDHKVPKVFRAMTVHLLDRVFKVSRVFRVR
jgi:hypothetical protein